MSEPREPRRTGTTFVGGAKNNLESSILLEIMCQVIEEGCSATVVRRHYSGESSDLYRQLLSDEIQLYPEASGSLLAQQLQVTWTEVFDAENHSTERLNLFLERAGLSSRMKLVALFGYDSGYAMAMKTTTAIALGFDRAVENPTLSDLARLTRVRRLRFRGDPTFVERPDGFVRMMSMYDMDVEHGGGDCLHDIVVKSLLAGDMELTDIFLTDPEIQGREAELTIFSDDRACFPRYRMGALAGYRLLAADPGVEAALTELTDTLQADHIRSLQAQLRQRDVTVVSLARSADARAFLRTLVLGFRRHR